jgi:hypothetical protein
MIEIDFAFHLFPPLPECLPIPVQLFLDGLAASVESIGAIYSALTITPSAMSNTEIMVRFVVITHTRLVTFYLIRFPPVPLVQPVHRVGKHLIYPFVGCHVGLS